MSLLLAVAAFIVFVVIDRIRRSRRHPAPVSPVMIRRYVHPGHAWVRETEDGDVLVGIDDFAQSLIGAVEGIELPRLLHRIEQGTAAWRIRHGERVVAMVSPVSGRVIEKNEMVLRNPGLVNTSPYADGWLIRVRPRKLPGQLHNLLTGRAAQQWIDGVRARLGSFFSGTPALLYQDGGVLMNNLADRCSDPEWQRLVKEFFLTEDTSTHS